MKNLVWQILAGILGIGLACHFIEGVNYDGKITTILLVGLALGLLNFFVKPILEKIILPLRVITLNLFSLVIVMGLIWIIDCIFAREQFEIMGIVNLFWTALIVWGIEILFTLGPSQK